MINPLPQVRNEDDSSRSGSYANSGDNSSDQDIFDYSKVPDVDPITRTRLGSTYHHMEFIMPRARAYSCDCVSCLPCIQSVVARARARARAYSCDCVSYLPCIQSVVARARARARARAHSCDCVLSPMHTECSGCGESIRSCQSLIALDSHWHLFCFTCSVCSKLLTAEYMTK